MSKQPAPRPRTPLSNISPIDGRYASGTAELTLFFSEFALIKARVEIEIQYLIAFLSASIPGQKQLSIEQRNALVSLVDNFETDDADAIKQIERTTNHDVKAVEYWLRGQLTMLGMADYIELIHFGLTSQDVNHTAMPLLCKRAHEQILLPALHNCIDTISEMAKAWAGLPLLARTHGQPASPTTLGKEMAVFAERLTKQKEWLDSYTFEAKFGGATGNFNAHQFVFPNIDWVRFGNDFVANFGLVRQQTTTQIEQYDALAAWFDCWKRINVILIDFARDAWQYISIGVFKLKVIDGEVGSSAMPHKVNPIDFENAEGNLMVANALFEFLSAKLPISRLQRDLTDSTVSRNMGVPFAHTLLALKSLQKGLSKILPDETQLHAELEANWSVVAEGIQNLLRALNYPDPYQALKELTRTGKSITKESMQLFVDGLDIPNEHKQRLLALTPHNYLGILGK